MLKKAVISILLLGLSAFMLASSASEADYIILKDEFKNVKVYEDVNVEVKSYYYDDYDVLHLNLYMENNSDVDYGFGEEAYIGYKDDDGDYYFKFYNKPYYTNEMLITLDQNTSKEYDLPVRMLCHNTLEKGEYRLLLAVNIMENGTFVNRYDESYLLERVSGLAYFAAEFEVK